MKQPVIETDVAGAPAATALELLRKQAAMFGRLESLAAKQRGLVNQDDAGPLLAVLGERQRLTSALAVIGKELQSARRNWAATRKALSPSGREEADGLLEQVQARMRRVIESDERDARVLSARRQTVAGELRQTQTVVHAVSAYRPDGMRVSPARRLDEAS